MSNQVFMQGRGSEPGRAQAPSRTRNEGLGAKARAVLEDVVQRDVVPTLVAMPWMRTRNAAQKNAQKNAQETTQKTAQPGSAQPEPAPPKPRTRAVPINKRTVARLVGLTLAPDGLAVAAMVAALHESGATPEAIYIDLLTPAARRLGEMWEHDECSFADVTMGVLRLQNAQRALAPAFRGTTRVGKGAPRVLLIPVPGEQHTFGLTIVADFFTRAGWDTWTGVVPTEKLALQMVRSEQVDMVGLSFACDERIDTAARLIAAFRRRAANPRMLVMVGGPSFVADPELAARVGADATAMDGHQAVLRANELLTRALAATASPGQPASG